MTSKLLVGPDGKPVDIVLPGEAPEAAAESFMKASDNADTQAIIREAVGGLPADVNIYAFRNAGKLLVGPSVTGITNLYIETYGNFAEFVECVVSSRAHVEPGVPSGGIIHTVAIRGRIQGGNISGAAWSIVEEPEFQHRRDGTWAWNKHAVTVASSKARRNVMRDLLKPANVVEFVKLCAKNSVKMLELTERDVELPSAESPEKARLRQRLFSLVQGAIDVTSKEGRSAWIAHVETVILGKRMSESTEQELSDAVKVVENLLPKMKPSEFKAMVLGGGKS
jgi:hypothetical protein